MAWDGWFQFDGSEIVNVTRTEQYARNMGITWLKPQFNNLDLPVMLGDGERYRTPLLDDAPWIDEDAGESEDFLGMYPLAIDGIESASRTGTVVESIGNGGAVIGVRHGTKSITFSGALCATSEDGAEYGLRWLKQVLNGSPCGGVSMDCTGGNLCYFSSSPALGNRWGSSVGYGYPTGVSTTTLLSEQKLLNPLFATSANWTAGNGTLNTPGAPFNFAGYSSSTNGLPNTSYFLSQDFPATEGREYEASVDVQPGGFLLSMNLQIIFKDALGAIIHSSTPTTTPELSWTSYHSVTNTALAPSGTATATFKVFPSVSMEDGGGWNTTNPQVSESYTTYEVTTAQDCLTDYQRTLTNVTVTQGPTVTAKRSLSDGAAVWTVSFTAVASSPYEFGKEQPIVEGFMHPTNNPWAPGVTGGVHTPGPYLVTEPDCLQQVYKAVYDPLCPALVPPPLPASVAMGCFTKPQNWYRRHITIPKAYVPLWGDVVPRIQIHAETEVRAMRLRFYADPYELGDPNTDPCSYCGDILISFIPPQSTLVFDGVEESVYVQYQGTERRRGDTLVFKSDGTPFDWPVLSCGSGYVVTFDMPQTQVAPLVDLSLTPRVI